MNHSLLNYLRDKLYKSNARNRFEVKVKKNQAVESYTMQISDKENNYKALYIRFFNELDAFVQEFSPEEKLTLVESHLTLDNNKEHNHATYVFQDENNNSKKTLRIYDINKATPSKIRLTTESGDNVETISFEEFKKIANPSLIKSIRDYQVLFEALSEEQVVQRNQLEENLEALIKSFHELLDQVERNHHVTQEQCDKFHDMTTRIKKIVEDITQVHAGNFYDLSFYENWNALLEAGDLSSKFYLTTELSPPQSSSETKNSESTLSNKKKKSSKNKRRKEKIKASSKNNENPYWKVIFDEYDKMKQASQSFREALLNSDLAAIRDLYDRVFQQPDFSSHLNIFFGLILKSSGSVYDQKKLLEINNFFLDEKKSEHYIFLFNYFSDHHKFAVETAQAWPPIIYFSPAGFSVFNGQADILEMFLRQQTKLNTALYFQTSELRPGQYKAIGLLDMAEIMLNSLPGVIVKGEDYASDIRKCVEVLLKYKAIMSYGIISTSSRVASSNINLNHDTNYKKNELKYMDIFIRFTEQLATYSPASREDIMAQRAIFFLSVMVFSAYGDTEIFDCTPEQARTSISRFIADQTALIETFEMEVLLYLYAYCIGDFKRALEEAKKDKQNISSAPLNDFEGQANVFEALLSEKIARCFSCATNAEQRKYMQYLIEKGTHDHPEFLSIGISFLSCINISESVNYVCALNYLIVCVQHPKIIISYEYDFPSQLGDADQRNALRKELEIDKTKCAAVEKQELTFLALITVTMRQICEKITKSHDASAIEAFVTLPEIMNVQQKCSYFVLENGFDILKNELKKAIDPVKEILAEKNIKFSEEKNEAFSKINQVIQKLNADWILYSDANSASGLWRASSTAEGNNNNYSFLNKSSNSTTL